MPQVSPALPGLWPLLKGFSSFAYNFYVGVLHDLFWAPCLIFSVDHWEFLCHQLFSSVQFSSVQFSSVFSSVTQSCPTLCDPMNRSTPALLVHHKLPEFTQTHVHWVGDAIQPSHPLSSPSPAPNPSQHHQLLLKMKSHFSVIAVWLYQLLLLWLRYILYVCTSVSIALNKGNNKNFYIEFSGRIIIIVKALEECSTCSKNR